MTDKLKTQLAAAKVMDEVSPLASLSRQRLWQMEMESLGLCRQCGGEYVKAGRKLCIRCLAKANVRAKRYRQRTLEHSSTLT